MKPHVSRAFSAFCFAIFAIALSAHSSGQAVSDTGWPTYGNDPGGSRYSGAGQINRGNVNSLRVAWTYRTGANEVPTKLIRKAAFEATPIIQDGKLFLITPYNHIIALEPDTGRKFWEYDPGVNLERSYSCLLYTSPSPRDRQKSRMPSSA